MSAQDTPPPAPAHRRGSLLLRALAWSFAGLVSLGVVLLAAGYLFLGSDAALDYAVQRAVAEADGHLVIEGAEGSLLSTVRVARIAWTGERVDVEARDAALTWSPLDLLSRRVVVQGLGAKRLSITYRKSEQSSPPSTLALPLEVVVRNIGVERLDWRSGERGGDVSGISFDYAGGAREHAIDRLRLVTDAGTLTGRARLGATPPYPLSAALAFVGDGGFQGGQADLAVAGTLERIAVDAKGKLRDASLAVKAVITPFEATAIASADIEAGNVDLAQFESALPATKVSLTLAARPQGAGFAGSLSARNAAAGTIDAGRIPVSALSSLFAWDGTTLALSGVDATFDGGGRATGRASLAVQTQRVSLDLALANVDLARLHSSVLATRLSGTLAGDVDRERQVLHGDLRQGDLALAFAGVAEGHRITLERATVQAGSGSVTGSGTFSLDRPRAFTLTARATRFNPARFVAMPDALIDGSLSASGTLVPAFAIAADVEIAQGSRLADLPLQGKAHAEVTPTTARNVAVKARLGASRIALDGAFGTPSDKLAYDIDIAQIAELRPLATRYAKALAPPDPLAGALRAKGSVTGDPRAPGFTIDAHAKGLEWGRRLRAATLDVAGSVAAGRTPAGAVALTERRIDVRLDATGVAAPQGKLATLSASAQGTLARHKVVLAATGEALDFAATASGGTDLTTWSGTIDTLRNRGTLALSLEAPTTLSVSSTRFALDAARLDVMQGRVEVARLLVEDGRISTQGTLTGVPLDAAARLAGTKLPFHSTMTVGGDWSIVAAPRMSGTINLARERGDWYASESTTDGALGLGISEVALAVRIDDDAFAATARFRSARAGDADATATLAAGRVPGHIDADAPFTAKVTANLASLRPLQPWIGTMAAMDGRARIAIGARGTLANPVLDGTMTGDALRFDLPQYGVHLRDGTLRARLAERTLVLDEVSFGGGSGRFTAKGTVLQVTGEGASAGSVEWQAENFTLVNRPDLRLVADGKGTLRLADRKLLLAGNIDFDQGRVTYERTRPGTLSEDVVIVGAPRAPPQSAGGNLPLALDLTVALGRDFRFTGEGLDTRLAGSVHVTTSPQGAINGTGTIRAVSGTFYVFGQRLDIDRGRLIFDGPVDNPALDVVALRRNLAVEAGVELTGTVRVPRVRLVSNPPVPDNEKLSWLLTGQGLDRASRNDLALLGAASASLLSGSEGRPITTRIANTLGLDEISVRESGNTVNGSTSPSQVVAFGKRISDRLTLVYEQGLTVATNALRIEYALTRTLTLRAEAGVVSSFGIYFRRTFD